jgi:microcin C transport system ATP-binding protein
MSLLEVDRLAVAFGDKRVVDGVSFAVDRGETLAIVGESGSGKSLTALSILQLLPSGACNPDGRVVLDGVETISASRRQLRRLRGSLAGMIFQEPMTSLNPLHRIGRQVSEAIALHQPLSRGAIRQRAVAVLESCGFADAAGRMDAFPHQLSGGQRQRVMIAMALANDPKLLIADEPTTALDVTIQAQILDLLAAQKASRGLALLLITHDLNIVRRYADRVLVMQNGVAVEQGDASRIFSAPEHSYTQMLLEAEPKGGPARLPAQARQIMEADDVRVHFSIRRGLLRRVVGVVKAVDGVSISVREGETVGLVGESGSGKSTMGFAMLRLEQSQGTIRFDGQDVKAADKATLRRMRARMQIVFQDPFGSLSPRLAVGDIVGEGLTVHARDVSAAARQERVREALKEVGLPAEVTERFPHEFSGGQRQRIAIARALVLKPRFLVLDEPTSALDRSVQAQIVELLRDLQQRHGLGYLFISHDLAVVRALAHQVVVLREGQVVEEGTAEAIFDAPRHPYTRALMAAALGRDAVQTVS